MCTSHLKLLNSLQTNAREKFDANTQCYFEINNDYFLIISENENIQLT